MLPLSRQIRAFSLQDLEEELALKTRMSLRATRRRNELGHELHEVQVVKE